MSDTCLAQGLSSQYCLSKSHHLLSFTTKYDLSQFLLREQWDSSRGFPPSFENTTREEEKHSS